MLTSGKIFVKISSVVTKRSTLINKRTRLNEAIRVPQLRIIDENDNQIGVMDTRDALQKAKDAGLDLVEVSPNAKPPVAKIVDWGKYNYQKTKQQQQSRKKNKNLDIKQIRFGLKIGEHDLDIKLKKVKSFLEAGHKVKITAFFRGREMAHKEIGYELLDKVLHKIEDIAVVEQEPQFSGKYLSILVRSSNAKVKNP